MTDENSMTPTSAPTVFNSPEDTHPNPTGGGKSPLLIGVAGHRDLRPDDRAAIEREVRCVFAELRKKYPHTPLALISPLADGADRVVASIAKEEGARVIAWHAGGKKAPSRDEQIVRLKMVRDHWIEDQLIYFTNNGPKNERYHRICSRISQLFFWLAITFGGLMLAVHLWTHHLDHWLAVAVFLCTAVAALCHEYGEKQAFAIHAKQYDWMRSFFATAKRHIDELIDAGDMDQSREFVLELGKEALQENAEWLLQHRQRPIKPPTV